MKAENLSFVGSRGRGVSYWNVSVLMENAFFALCPLGFPKTVSAEMPDKTPGGTEPVPRSEG